MGLWRLVELGLAELAVRPGELLAESLVVVAEAAELGARGLESASQ